MGIILLLRLSHIHHTHYPNPSTQGQGKTSILVHTNKSRAIVQNSSVLVHSIEYRGVQVVCALRLLDNFTDQLFVPLRLASEYPKPTRTIDHSVSRPASALSASEGGLPPNDECIFVQPVWIVLIAVCGDLFLIFENPVWAGEEAWKKARSDL